MNLYQPTISGSFTVSGSSTFYGNVTISGSVSATSSVAISSSYATSASNADFLDGLDSTYFVPSSSYDTMSGSIALRATNLESTASVLTSASASFAVVSSSYASASGSIASRVTKIEGNYATTGSNAFNGSQNITGSLTVSQAVIAQTLNVQQVTSSIVYSCGSNIFGCAIGDVQQMTGSVRITGSLNTIGNACITSVCSPTFVGGTVSGTTIYGSTAICSANGLLIGNGGVTATCNYIPKFTGTSTIGNSIVYDDGAVGIGTLSATAINNASGLANLVVGNGGGASQGITIYTNSSTYGGLNFADATTGGGAYAGYIKFDHTNDNLSFFIGNTQRLTLNASGNLGLGVTPSAWFSDRRAFQIQSGGSINSSASTIAFVELGANFFHGSLGDTYVGSSSASKYRQLSGGHEWYTAPSGTAGCAISFTQAMTLDASGRLGIGTTSPCTTLTVEGANKAFPLLYNTGYGNVHIQTNETTATQNFGGTLTFGGLGRTSGPTEKFIWAAIAGRKETTTGGDPAGYLQFGTVSNDTNEIKERMRITSAGCVGIGTPSPNGLLHLQQCIGGEVGFGITNSQGAAGNTSATVAINMTLQNGSGGSSGVVQLIAGKESDHQTAANVDDYFAITTTSNDTTTERMRITSGGAILINTSSVGGKLYVYNPATDFQTNTIKGHDANASTTTDGIIVSVAERNTTNNTFYAFGYYNNGAGAWKFRVADSGNVTNTNNSYGQISDIKLKENISDASPKLADILKVKIKNFNFIGDNQKQIGVIAQELEEIFPSMIEIHNDRDENGNDLGTITKSVKYSVFVPMLIKAIQEQQCQICTQSTIIDQLKTCLGII